MMVLALRKHTLSIAALTLVVVAGMAQPVDAAPSVTSAITLPIGSQPNSVAFSPDGTKAYVANSYGGTVSVVATH